MATDIRKTQEQEGTQAVLDHAFKGKPVDPAVSKRIHERAEAIRKNLPLTNIAVDLIRELRDE